MPLYRCSDPECEECIRAFGPEAKPAEPVADICGLCGEPGADKMAVWTGGGVYWPGEQRPDTDMVHSECEQAERDRAHAALTPAQRRATLDSLYR